MKADQDLDTILRAHYEEAGLSEQELDRIVTSPEKKRPRGTSKGLRVAAGVLVVLTVAGLGWASRDLWQLSRNHAARAAAAQEVALNHNKRLRLEFRARNLRGLRRQMGRIDFPLASLNQTGGARLAGLTLTGARYCSIQGRLAAQLRFVGPQGEYVSVYVARPSPELQSLTSVDERVVGGVHVQLWQEHGLVYAIARTSNVR